jgi:hypothetical protein
MEKFGAFQGVQFVTPVTFMSDLVDVRRHMVHGAERLQNFFGKDSFNSVDFPGKPNLSQIFGDRKSNRLRSGFNGLSLDECTLDTQKLVHLHRLFGPAAFLLIVISFFHKNVLQRFSECDSMRKTVSPNAIA